MYIQYSYFKKPNPVGFWGFIGFWVLLGFSDFLFERAVGKLVGFLVSKFIKTVDLARQLSFYSVLLIIQKFANSLLIYLFIYLYTIQ